MAIRKIAEVILANINDLAGRFHPVLVHLPIGILLLACFFYLLSAKPSFRMLAPAVPAIMFWGMISAVLSVVTGLMLASTGGYDDVLVAQHQWAGIGVAALSIVLYLVVKKITIRLPAAVISVALIILVTITGHLGGSITHGEDYLSAGLEGAASKPALPAIPNIQRAAVYNDIVQPLLEARCYNCHSARKQKGKLRLDSPERMLAGGEDGKVIVAGKADESELISRLLLPASDDDHMPPKGKPQLTTPQVQLLQWWVATGADFSKKVAQLEQSEKIRPVLAALQEGSGMEETETPGEVPTESVPPADTASIHALARAGIIVIPVAQGSNYLSVNFVTATGDVGQNIRLLEPLRRQLVRLKLDGVPLQDSAMPLIGKLTALTRLQLSHTKLTDKGLPALQALKNLQSLNLVGTGVTAPGVLVLRSLPALRRLYLYQTGVRAVDWPGLVKAFPSATLDSGNYRLPMLASDTTLVPLNR